MNMAIPILVFLVVLAVNYGIRHLKVKRRQDEARRVAAERGYSVDVNNRGVPFEGFDLLNNGDSRYTSMRFTRAGNDDTVFQFTYKDDRTDSDGGSSKTYHHTCAIVTMPFHAPRTTIGREGLFSKLARAVGRRDIEVESDRFNKRFKVKGDDERFAITLLDGETITWFLREEGYAAIADYELLGGRMLVEVSGELDPNTMIDFLEWAVTVPEGFPTVLRTLYNEAS